MSRDLPPMPRELMVLRRLADRYGDVWDLYVWGVRAEWFDSPTGERLTYWIEWAGVAHGASPTREILTAAHAANRTVGLRVPTATAHAHSDLGHAFWRGHQSTAIRPFVAGTESCEAIRSHSLVLADALLGLEVG